MTPGTISKRCGCKHPDTGKRLGTHCPDLRRPGGAWSASHGVSCLQLELPASPGMKRRQYRRSGFGNRKLTLGIGQLLHDLPAGHPLPTPEAVARKLRAENIHGVSVRVGDYLDDWLAGREGLSPATTHSYRSHIDKHVKPHLGHIGIDGLRPIHIKDMFTAIKATTTAI